MDDGNLMDFSEDIDLYTGDVHGHNEFRKEDGSDSTLGYEYSDEPAKVVQEKFSQPAVSSMDLSSFSHSREQHNTTHVADDSADDTDSGMNNITYDLALGEQDLRSDLNNEIQIPSLGATPIANEDLFEGSMAQLRSAEDDNDHRHDPPDPIHHTSVNDDADTYNPQVDVDLSLNEDGTIQESQISKNTEQSPQKANADTYPAENYSSHDAGAPLVDYSDGRNQVSSAGNDGDVDASAQPLDHEVFLAGARDHENEDLISYADTTYHISNAEFEQGNNTTSNLVDESEAPSASSNAAGPERSGLRETGELGQHNDESISVSNNEAGERHQTPNVNRTAAEENFNAADYSSNTQDRYFEAEIAGQDSYDEQNEYPNFDDQTANRSTGYSHPDNFSGQSADASVTADVVEHTDYHENVPEQDDERSGEGSLRNESGEFSQHSTPSAPSALVVHVEVVWKQQTMSLFPVSSSAALLDNANWANEPFDRLFSAVRQALGNELSDDEWLQVDITNLDVRVAEDSIESTEATLAEMVDIYRQLCLNAHFQEIDPLLIELRPLPKFTSRLGYLRRAAQDGVGVYDAVPDNEAGPESSEDVGDEYESNGLEAESEHIEQSDAQYDRDGTEESPDNEEQFNVQHDHHGIEDKFENGDQLDGQYDPNDFGEGFDGHSVAEGNNGAFDEYENTVNLEVEVFSHDVEDGTIGEGISVPSHDVHELEDGSEGGFESAEKADVPEAHVEEEITWDSDDDEPSATNPESPGKRGLDELEDPEVDSSDKKRARLI